MAKDWARTIIATAPAAYAPPPNRVAKVLIQTSEFAALFRTCQSRNIWPAPDLSEARMAPIPAFRDLDLPSPTSSAALTEWLMLPAEHIAYYADQNGRAERHDDMAVNHYHYP